MMDGIFAASIDDDEKGFAGLLFTLSEVDRVARGILTDKQYEVFYMYCFLNKKQKEIAKELNITQQAVSDRWVLAKKKIRKFFLMNQ